MNVVLVDFTNEEAEDHKCIVCGHHHAHHGVQSIENNVYREVAVCSTCMYMLTFGKLKTENRIVNEALKVFMQTRYSFWDRVMFWWLPKRDWMKYRFKKLAKS